MNAYTPVSKTLSITSRLVCSRWIDWLTVLVFFIILGVGPLHPVAAEPVIIYDSGRTTPFPIVIKPMNTRVAIPHPITTAFDGFVGLPVKTPAMTPGRVVTRTVDHGLRTHLNHLAYLTHLTHLTQPIFIVGADALSKRWLTKNRDRLLKHHAVGMAVNINTQAELTALRQAAGGLSVNPVSGDKIARQLSLKHYPVLISSAGISQ